MCGIAGFVEGPEARPMACATARAAAQAMCDAIRHRGPDDQGVFVDDGVALGMRRLSIIDLETGHQPIANETGSVWTVFNGEIYNYRELRTDLQRRGHRFATGTDTEVIVHGYEEWGTGVFTRVHGMFGIAIWDTRTRTLVLGRDRLGIKPLHWTETAGRLAFASEIKSLLALPDQARSLDLDALSHYLSFLYTPPTHAIFGGVRKLPPGHLLVWRDGTARTERYWALSPGETFRGSRDEAVDELHGHLRAAVARHLMSDVPLGAFLSGGIDSALVVGLMAQASSTRVQTFSIGFDEPEFDELDGARLVARHFDTDHHELVVRPDAVAVLDTLIDHFDEPFADSSAIPTFYVSQLARRHVTVVLSGDGGDELFGGYDRYVPSPRVAAFDRSCPDALRPVAGTAARWLPRGAKGRRFLRHVGLDRQARYIDALHQYSEDDKAALLTDDVRMALRARPPETMLADAFDRFSGASWPAQMMRVDTTTYLPEDILVKVDRMSMAHSIESRVPLLDDELVAFAASLPAGLHLADGHRKRLLRAVAARVLPAATLARPKRGFGVPLAQWFRGRLRDLLADTILSPRALQRGYFRPAAVRALVDEHLRGRRDHTLRLWQLVVFERWHDRYLDQPPPRQAITTPGHSRSVGAARR